MKTFQPYCVICVLVLLCIINGIQSIENDQEWFLWKSEQNKQYTNLDEELKRYSIFKENVAKINAHNLKMKNLNSTFDWFTMGINKFADLTWNEFKAKYLGLGLNSNNIEQPGEYFDDFNKTISIPASFDWHKKKAVTPIKDQGECGSCWAFSAVGALEGQLRKKGIKLQNLSAQQLVDCSGSFGNDGCEGGLMDQAFDYVKANGIENEIDYPYKAFDNKCQYKKSKVVLQIKTFKDVPTKNEKLLKRVVYTTGPTSVAMDVVSSFQFYRSGIYHDLDCNSGLNHGVLIIGYGIKHLKPYWRIKNSWGLGWGEQGYFRIVRGKNMCGIASIPSIPVV